MTRSIYAAHLASALISGLITEKQLTEIQCDVAWSAFTKVTVDLSNFPDPIELATPTNTPPSAAHRVR